MKLSFVCFLHVYKLKKSNSNYFNLKKDLQSDGVNKFFTLFVRKSTNETQQKSIGYGFRQLTDTEQAVYCFNSSRQEITTVPLLSDTFNFSSVLSFKISQRVFASGCYYLDESNYSWSTKGVEILPTSTINTTQCVSTHLTQFAGGLIILPPEINFASVWANASFDKNPTIYLTVIVISSIYLLLLVWCQFMDRKDKKRRNVCLLVDNDPFDMYFYELIVFTGNRNDAGTESNVSFYLEGSLGDVFNRKLSPLNQKIKPLQRGSVDSFIMSINK